MLRHQKDIVMDKGTAVVACAICFVGGIFVGHAFNPGSNAADGESDAVVVAAAGEAAVGARGAGEAPAARPTPAPGKAPTPAARPGRPNPATTYRIDFPTPAPQRGPDDALVTLVMWSDFQCPFCGRVEPTINQLVERYGNDLRVVWMNNPLPFHSEAKPAAVLALEAFDQGGNAKFWQVHDALIAAGPRALNRAKFEEIAQGAGLNMAQVRAALDGNEHDAAITAAQTLGRRFGARGTPAFYINGRFLSGAQPVERFQALIDEEMAKARRLVASGTPRAQVYARTIARGETEVAAAPPPAPVRSTLTPPAAGEAPSKGPANAPVVIQEISDFECPFCGRVNPTIAQIMREYPTQVRIVWRDFPLPFHRNAALAHEAAREVFLQAGDEKFWAYHDLLFANRTQLTRENLEAWAQQVGGVNMGRFRAALDGRTHQAAIEASKRAVTAGITGGRGVGTPTFIINGEVISGAQPFPNFKAAIDRALAARR